MVSRMLILILVIWLATWLLGYLTAEPAPPPTALPTPPRTGPSSVFILNAAFVVLGVILLIPCVIGLYLIKARPTPLRLMAGLFTLKPVALTLPWLLLGGLDQTSRLLGDWSYAVMLIPAVLVTLGLGVRFRAVLLGPLTWWAAWVLVAMDCARWLNSLFLFSRLPWSGSASMVVGLALPTVYAIGAWLLSHICDRHLLE